MTPKQKYQDIDLSKLPANAAAQLKKIEPILFEDKYQGEDKKEEREKAELVMDKLYKATNEKYPEAVISKQPKAPETTPEPAKKPAAKKASKPAAKKTSTTKPKATAKSTKRGDISHLAKQIRKEGERWQDAVKRAGEMIQAEKKKATDKQSKQLNTFLKKNQIPAGSTTIGRDAPRKALPAGRRLSKDGNVYYEYRQNRTDKNRKRYPYLALGGKLHGAGIFEKGGVLEIDNFHKNILGTLSFNLKLPNMRKAQDFNVYPVAEKSDFITIQSSTRIGKIEMATGRGLMSQSYPNGAYFVHFQIDMATGKLVKFQLDDEQLKNLKKEVAKTAGKSVGSNIITSDNSYADKFAKGGKVGNKFQQIEDIGDTQYYSRYFGKVYTSDEKDKEVAVNLLVVATIQDLESAVSENDLPKEGNFQVTFDLVPETKFMSKEFLEQANSENNSVSNNELVNIVNYMGGLRFEPSDKIFFKTQEAAEKLLMSKELNDQITAMGSLSGFTMDKAYNRIGQSNWERLNYMMGITDSFAKGGEVKIIETSYDGVEFSRTAIYKGYYGWTADTFTKAKINGFDWQITTMKRYSGELLTTATAGQIMPSQGSGFTGFTYAPHQDPSFDLISSRPKMVNERAVREQHIEALKKFATMVNSGKLAKGGHMAKGGELTESQILAKTIVYDNEGKSFDRYTVFTPDGSVYGMSENATGFNLYVGDDTEIEKGSHLGKRLKSIPESIKAAILDRMNPDNYAKGGETNSHLDELYKKANNNIFAALQLYAGELGIYNMYYGDKVDAKQKRKYERAKAYLTNKYRSGHMADGGEMTNKKYILTGYSAEAYEDDFEQGELGHTGSWHEDISRTFSSKKALIDFINDVIIYQDYDEKDFDWEAGEGRYIATSVTCSYDDYTGYYPADEKEIELWKEGKKKLYSVHYTIYVIAALPTEYAKGGKLSSKATYIPNRSIISLKAKLKNKELSLKGSDILDGVYAKKKALKSTFDAESVFREISDLAFQVWEKLGVNSGEEIYQKDALQKKINTAFEKVGIDAIYTSLTQKQRMEVAEILTDENYHSLRQYLALRGYNGKAEYEEYKRLFNKYSKDKWSYFLNPANITYQPDKKYAAGGELELDRFRGAGMFAEGGIMDEATAESIHDGFTISEMNELLRRLFPYSFGFEVFKPVKGQDILLPDYDEAPSALRGYSDADLKSKLYFPKYKRDHDINFCINQGGENTYFFFTLNNENGDFLVGTFGFKDRGDVSPEYITSFIAFLMQCYDLPFKVKHTAYAKGGHMAKGGGIYGTGNADFYEERTTEPYDFKDYPYKLMNKVEVDYNLEYDQGHIRSTIMRADNGYILRQETLPISAGGVSKLYSMLDGVMHGIVHRKFAKGGHMANGGMTNTAKYYWNMFDMERRKEFLITAGYSPSVANNLKHEDWDSLETGVHRKLTATLLAQGGELNNLMPHSKTHRTDEK